MVSSYLDIVGDPVGGMYLEDVRRDPIPDVTPFVGDDFSLVSVNPENGRLTLPPPGVCGEGAQADPLAKISFDDSDSRDWLLQAIEGATVELPGEVYAERK